MFLLRRSFYVHADLNVYIINIFVHWVIFYKLFFILLHKSIEYIWMVVKRPYFYVRAYVISNNFLHFLHKSVDDIQMLLLLSRLAISSVFVNVALLLLQNCIPVTINVFTSFIFSCTSIIISEHWTVNFFSLVVSSFRFTKHCWSSDVSTFCWYLRWIVNSCHKALIWSCCSEMFLKKW